jgi:uncharacterized membrane protein YeaQ/YmgE (transglycosylase-associated protein family)
MIWTLIVGLVVGLIAKLLMPGRDPGGFVITMLLGVAGAMLANFVGSRVGWYEFGDTAGIIASVIGAIILLSIYRALTKKQHSLPHH